MRATHFIRSRAEQLADYLRDRIRRGEIVEPLPCIRDWSLRLGVGRGTLELALKHLRREGLVRIRARKGIDLLRPSRPPRSLPPSRVVRWIAYGRDFPDISNLMEILEAISAGLSVHEIRFNIEKCNSARLKAIHRRGEHVNEMLLLASLPRKFQALFADFQRSALLIGAPFPGIPLPFVSIDVRSAIRHATLWLVRRGFSRITLIVREGSHEPLNELFRRICSELPQIVHEEVVRLPMELHQQARAARALAARITGRHALIAVYPIPTSMLITALMEKGVRVPDPVDVVAINTTLQCIRTVPIPTSYLYPVRQLSNFVCRAALRYFEQGALPPFKATIPLEMTPPSRYAGESVPAAFGARE